MKIEPPNQRVLDRELLKLTDEYRECEEGYVTAYEVLKGEFLKLLNHRAKVPEREAVNIMEGVRILSSQSAYGVQVYIMSVVNALRLDRSFAEHGDYVKDYSTEENTAFHDQARKVEACASDFMRKGAAEKDMELTSRLCSHDGFFMALAHTLYGDALYEIDAGSDYRVSPGALVWGYPINYSMRALVANVYGGAWPLRKAATVGRRRIRWEAGV